MNNLSKKIITIVLLISFYIPISLKALTCEALNSEKSSLLQENLKLIDHTPHPNNDFIYRFFRMQYLTRWHMYNNLKYENLEEHSFETAIIAMTLAYISNAYYNGNINAEHLAIIDLFHDYPETETGDIPSPTHHNPKIAEKFENFEKEIIENLIEQIPVPFREKFASYIDTKNEDEKILKLLKAADKISALIKCLREHQMGNIDFKTAEKNVICSLHKLDMPEVEYFLKNCMGGFDFSDVVN